MSSFSRPNGIKMAAYEKRQKQLSARPKTWLVTGAAGFIGSHLVEKLLGLNQRVVGLDNFSTGHKRNLTAVRGIVGPNAWQNFRFIKGDIRNLSTCKRVCEGVDYVLHQAAIGSVPRSIDDPLTSNESNVTGFLNMLTAARDAKIKRFVYASSSAVYGDEETLPKVENRIGRLLSPYAVTKRVNELYAEAFARCYGMQLIGLRYFNVFGPRQDPNGAYAAVIPRWLAAMRQGQPTYINGDGETTRDFCYVLDVVKANVLAATTHRSGAASEVFNIACSERTSLSALFAAMQTELQEKIEDLKVSKPKHTKFRPGDIRHSVADISRAVEELDYKPTHLLADGIRATVNHLLKYSH